MIATSQRTRRLSLLRLLVIVGFGCLTASPSVAENRLRWTIELPPRQTKWRHVKDMHKDVAYRPTFAGGLVFIGCEHNGALLAVDAVTGEERWRFYSDGAIRTQPVADADRVLFGSDDGHAYCLGHDGKAKDAGKFLIASAFHSFRNLLAAVDHGPADGSY
ncbi:MAG: PQQ-binding-like beta-propeller repeat protein [Planctomycetales bacterium]